MTATDTAWWHRIPRAAKLGALGALIIGGSIATAIDGREAAFADTASGVVHSSDDSIATRSEGPASRATDRQELDAAERAAAKQAAAEQAAAERAAAERAAAERAAAERAAAEQAAAEQAAAERAAAERAAGEQAAAERAAAELAAVEAAANKVVMPLDAGTYSHTSSYGARAGGFHLGTDMGAPRDTPIRAAAAGTVVHAGAGIQGRSSNLISIKHNINGQTFYTWYVHMYDDGVYVTQGQQVAAGDVIGGVGSNGNSTGNHLHFEVHPADGRTIEPLGWLRQHGA
ncbi:M23 family metallopeptidase [Georgenia ruanii]|nr:M23 family metallopeptidase [Georgenia ruanii]